MVEGRGSRVTSRGSRVDGRGSRVEKLFKIIFKLFSNLFQGRVYSSFRCLFLPYWVIFLFVKNVYIPRTLRRAEHQNLALSIFTVKLFFSGRRIRIIAEDNANAEDAVTYRCNTQVLKQYCLFRTETQWFFFLSNDSLAYEKTISS